MHLLNFCTDPHLKRDKSVVFTLGNFDLSKFKTGTKFCQTKDLYKIYCILKVISLSIGLRSFIMSKLVVHLKSGVF